ncbi:MAG: MFS transporter [Thermoplasmataceae archaeon]
MVRFTRHAGLTIGIMAFMGILINYVETMIMPATPVLEKFFSTNYDSLSWIITAYVISGTISAALFGRLADMYGKKNIFLILALIYAVAVSFGGFATTLDQLIFIRSIQGLGMGMFPVAFALLNDQVPKHDLALAQGILSSTFTGGAAIGLVFGAWITQNYSWEWSYHSAIPFAFGLFFLALIVLKDSSTRSKQRIDFAGVGLLAVGVVTLILGISEGEYWGWSSIRITASFAVSVLSLIAFVLVERRAESPFISMKLLRIRNVLLSNFTGLFAMAGMFFLFYSVPTLLQDPSPSGFGLSIFSAGLVMLPAALVSMLFAPLSALVTKARGPKISILIGTIVLFAAYVGLYLYRSTVLNITEEAVIMGIGLSFIFVGVINILLVSTPSKESGASTGMNVVFRNIGSSIAPAISGVLETMYVMPVTIQTVQGSYVRMFPSSQAFSYVYLIGMVFLLVSVFFTLLMKNVILKDGGKGETDNETGETVQRQPNLDG